MPASTPPETSRSPVPAGAVPAPSLEALPTRSEIVLAYSCAALSSLVWMGGVIPGTWAPADPTSADDVWTPIARGAPLLLPALLLLIAGPISAVLCRGPTALRALLAAGDAYVTGVMAVALYATHDKDPALLVAVAFLAIMCLVALRDAVVVVKDGGADTGWRGDVNAPPRSFRTTDVRLALSMLVLLTPARLFAEPHRERASLLAPFAYVAISALGSRFATTERSLRLTGAVLVSLVASHLVVAVRYVLDQGEGAGRRWTWAGTTTFATSCAVLLVALARVVVVMRGPRGVPAATLPPEVPPSAADGPPAPTAAPRPATTDAASPTAEADRAGPGLP